MATVGDRIKALRTAAGMSQTELAEHIKVSKQTLYKYENNIITNIPSDKIEAIALALNASPSDIMGWEQDEKKYYLDNDARDLAQFLFDNPEYKVLFDASRKIKKEDIEFVRQMLDRMMNQ